MSNENNITSSDGERSNSNTLNMDLYTILNQFFQLKTLKVYQ